ncbi:hypothetical protein BDW02DRAFT_469639, partial [Decorospora gaudefroyi]
PDQCAICLNDLAQEPPVGTRRPLTEAEKRFLQGTSPITNILDLYKGNKENHTPTPPIANYDTMAEPGLRLSGCGHAFGATCIKEWFKTRSTCPMCRVEQFVDWETKPG